MPCADAQVQGRFPRVASTRSIHVQRRIVHCGGRANRCLDGLPIFLSAYCIYFIVGSINVVPLRGEVDSKVVWIAVWGLAWACAGAAILEVLSPPLAQIKGRGQKCGRRPVAPSKRALVDIIGVVGFGAVIAIPIEFGQIPLFSGEARLGISSQLAVLAYGLVLWITWQGGGMLLRAGSKRSVFLLVVAALLLLLMGFRTVTLVVLITLALQARYLGIIRFRFKSIATAVFALFMFSWVSVYRFGAGSESYLNQLRRLGMDPWFEPFAPVWATAREGVGVLNELIQIVPSDVAEGRGRVLWSTFSTILPGDQMGPRLIVSQLVQARRGITITPSILGEPYLDFGWWGVAVFMAVLAGVLKLLYRWQTTARTSGPLTLYCYTLSFALLCIHSGLLDIVVFLSWGVLFILALNSESRFKRESSDEPRSGGVRDVRLHSG
jgi:hypothetical protein